MKKCKCKCEKDRDLQISMEEIVMDALLEVANKKIKTMITIYEMSSFLQEIQDWYEGEGYESDTPWIIEIVERAEDLKKYVDKLKKDQYKL